MHKIFNHPEDPTGIEKTDKQVVITTRDKVTVADAIRLKQDGYEFKDVQPQKKGFKKYIFNKK